MPICLATSSRMTRGDEVESKGSEVTWAAGQASVESVDEERWLLGIESRRRKNAK